MDALNIINYVISIIFILCYSYQFFYILVPVFKKERPHRSEQGHDYAVLISARNEQAVIGTSRELRANGLGLLRRQAKHEVHGLLARQAGLVDVRGDDLQRETRV